MAVKSKYDMDKL